MSVFVSLGFSSFVFVGVNAAGLSDFFEIKRIAGWFNLGTFLDISHIYTATNVKNQISPHLTKRKTWANTISSESSA